MLSPAHAERAGPGRDDDRRPQRAPARPARPPRRRNAAAPGPGRGEPFRLAHAPLAPHRALTAGRADRHRRVLARRPAARAPAAFHDRREPRRRAGDDRHAARAAIPGGRRQDPLDQRLDKPDQPGHPRQPGLRHLPGHGAARATRHRRPGADRARAPADRLRRRPRRRGPPPAGGTHRRLLRRRLGVPPLRRQAGEGRQCAHVARALPRFRPRGAGRDRGQRLPLHQ